MRSESSHREKSRWRIRSREKVLVRLEGSYSRSSEKDSTLSKLERKLLRSPLGFQNCTKTAKYEALEKNVVSDRKLQSPRQSLVRVQLEGLSLLGILGPVD